jgi:hypothetical protein
MYKRLQVSNFAQDTSEDKRKQLMHTALGAGALAAGGLGVYNLTRGRDNRVSAKIPRRPPPDFDFNAPFEKFDRAVKRNLNKVHKDLERKNLKRQLENRQREIDEMAKAANERLAYERTYANKTRPTNQIFKERVGLGKQLRNTPKTPDNQKTIEDLNTRRAILRGELEDSMKWDEEDVVSPEYAVSRMRDVARRGMLDEGDFGAYNPRYKRLSISNFAQSI